LVTNGQFQEVLDDWYVHDYFFRLGLDGILNHLNIPATIDLRERLQLWGLRGFDIDYQDPVYVSYINGLRMHLQNQGGLTLEGLVTPDTTPKTSPSRRGGGGNAGGGGNVGEAPAAH
jgi:hypothetical protein